MEILLSVLAGMFGYMVAHILIVTVTNRRAEPDTPTPIQEPAFTRKRGRIVRITMQRQGSRLWINFVRVLLAYERGNLFVADEYFIPASGEQRWEGEASYASYVRLVNYLATHNEWLIRYTDNGWSCRLCSSE